MEDFYNPEIHTNDQRENVREALIEQAQRSTCLCLVDLPSRCRNCSLEGEHSNICRFCDETYPAKE